MTKETFSKSERIRKKRDFLAIQRWGLRLHSRHFTLLYHRNQLGLSRLGITASRKVGSAVRRNRIKRLLREFFRLNKSSLKCAEDILLIVRKGIANLTYHEVKGELEELLRNRIDAR